MARYSYHPTFGPSGLLKGNEALLMPAGTVRVEDFGDWAIYYNQGLNTTWLVYALRAGRQIRRLPGKYNVNYNLPSMSHMVKVRQAQECGDCK